MKNLNFLSSDIIKKISKDTCYFLSPCGLGDTLILVSLKETLENFYNLKIHFLVKPTHQIIMNLYNIDSYTVVDMPSLKKLREKIDKNQINNNQVSGGKLFIAHPLFIKDESILKTFNAGKISFYEMYLNMLGLSSNIKFNDRIIELKTNIDEINEKLKKHNIKDINNLILIAPEADSCPTFPNSYWEKVIEKYRMLGYDVLTNAKSEKNSIRGTKFMPLTIEEAILIAQKCAGIISLRSGFCDVVALKHAGFLKVLYPNINILNLYSLKRSFSYNNLQELTVNLYKYKMDCYLFGIKIFKFVKYKNLKDFDLQIFGLSLLNG